MRKIERNGKSKLKQKLPTPVGGDNDIKMDVVLSALNIPQRHKFSFRKFHLFSGMYLFFRNAYFPEFIFEVCSLRTKIAEFILAIEGMKSLKMV